MSRKGTFVGIKFRSMFIAATMSMLVEYIMSLTDKIIAGNLLETSALSALTLTEPLTLLIAFVSCVLSAGAGVQVSAALGKGDQKKAEQQFSQILMLAVGIGAIATVVYIVFTEQIVAALAGGQPEVKYVAEYFDFARILPIPMLLNAVLFPVVLYRGGEKYCNMSAALSVVGNIGVSIVLVLNMGMAGISLGTVIGSWIGLLPLFLFFFTKKGYMKFRFHLSLKDIRGMGIYSIGNSIIYFYMAIFQASMNAFLISRFDNTAIVVFTGVVNVSGLFAALSDGIGEYLLPMINMYRGEENVIGEKKVLNISIKASVIEGLAVMVIMLLFANFMPTLFGVDDPTVKSDFVNAAMIYSLGACFFYILNIYVKYYLYVGKTANSLILSLCMNLVFPLAFGLIGGFAIGMTGVWIGMAVALALLVAIAYIIIRRQRSADKLCRFLNQEKMACQYCWDAEMSQEGISSLMDNVEKYLSEKEVSRTCINKVLLAIEETQMGNLEKEKNSGKVLIECTIFLEETVKLILRNTAITYNPIEDNLDEVNKTRRQILSGMQNKSYILVNGSNRLIFEF